MRRLHRADQFFGQDLGFLGEVAGAGPVAGLRRFARIFEEAFDLGNQVGLRRTQFFAARGREVFFGDAQALVRFLLRGGGFLLRELRRDGRSFRRFVRVRDGRRGSRRRSGGGMRPRRRAAQRNHHGGKRRDVEVEFRSFHVRVVRAGGAFLEDRMHLSRGGPGNGRSPAEQATSKQKGQGKKR